MGAMLLRLLRECGACSRYFCENVGTLVDDNGHLTEEQVESVLVCLLDRHRKCKSGALSWRSLGSRS